MTGSDMYIVDNAGNVVVEAASGGRDVIHAFVSHALSLHVENLLMTGATRVNGGGNDILGGGTGNDRFDGGAGTDWGSFMGQGRAARIDLAVTGPQATWHGLDGIRHIENIHGGRGSDVVMGNAWANLIRTGHGVDIRHGKAGR